VKRAAAVLFVLLLAGPACGGSPATSNTPPATSPTPAAKPSPSPTANPALMIFDRSAAVMLTLAYTVHRQWLKPQAQTLAPVAWKPAQAPELTMLAIDAPSYTFTSTTDTSPHCPNTICYVVHVAGQKHGSPAACTLGADVYIDGTTSRNLSRHVLGSGAAGSGCEPADVEGWDSITFP
jgi:hypothetical protein